MESVEVDGGIGGVGGCNGLGGGVVPWLAAAEQEVQRRMHRIEASRDLTRICVVCDMDMFYCAVELQERPDLVDQPVAVGSTGMITTANYVARRWGEMVERR